MVSAPVRFPTEMELSQVAAKVAWEFFKQGKDGTADAVRAVAQLALDLCKTLHAAEAIVRRGNAEEIPDAVMIPVPRQMMLLAERTRPHANTLKYSAIADYACEHEDTVLKIASGEVSPSPSELEFLSEHFASLSLALAEADL